MKKSVRSLVEFLFRSGDLDSRIGAFSEEAMLEGARLHRKLQKEGGPFYHAEVPLRYLWETDHFTLELSGRADGILWPETVETAGSPDLPLIDEIKGTYRRLRDIKEPEPVHLAQAKCYAFMFLSAIRQGEFSYEGASQLKETSEIQVQITYVNIDSEKIKRFQETDTFAELSEWFFNVLKAYEPWAAFMASWQLERSAAIGAMRFPYPFREGQKRLIGQVYQTIQEGKKLFIEAPTGVGKTLASLYPALKAFGEGKFERIFYLTAKNMTGAVAKNAIGILRGGGLCLKSLELSAREKACMTGEVKCYPEACPFAEGHYDRINEALFNMLLQEDEWGRETLQRYAGKHRVCPYEMSMDLSLFADCLICDYNYAFDRDVSLTGLLGEGEKGKSLFLIDEAHNLVDRGREMYSASLAREALLEARKGFRGCKALTKVSKAAGACGKMLKAYEEEGQGEDHFFMPSSPEGFISLVYTLGECLKEALAKDRKGGEEEGGAGAKPIPAEMREIALGLYFEVVSFLETWEGMGEGYQVYASRGPKGYAFRIACLDPSENLRDRMDRAQSVILFSATLLPIRYYKKLLGGNEEDYEVYADSVFDKHRLGVFIAGDVTSKYSRRNASEYKNIAEYILKTVSARPGNYMVFFPSYLFMEQVAAALFGLESGTQQLQMVFQGRNMSEQDRSEFLKPFQERLPQSHSSLVGFCVLGGAFSEGIDLKGESLVGALVVGTGLPMVCRENEILREHFSREGKGFEYAYLFPGMNKVLQAAGRVIRSAEDAGVVVLLDERFLSASYHKLFPREWQSPRRVSLETVGSEVGRFWEELREK
ncbi:MAG: ATP-dependent DNA helicase [Lachnospiraceae bacterium]|nr:ATP-dependent DNA helicase [Lachnospiraceae bacterium]